MKQLLLFSIVAGIFLASCGDASENASEEVSSAEADEAPRAAINDCPDNLPEGMVEMMESTDELQDMVDDLDAELEDLGEE